MDPGSPLKTAETGQAYSEISAPLKMVETGQLMQRLIQVLLKVAETRKLPRSVSETTGPAKRRRPASPHPGPAGHTRRAARTRAFRPAGLRSAPPRDASAESPRELRRSRAARAARAGALGRPPAEGAVSAVGPGVVGFRAGFWGPAGTEAQAVAEGAGPDSAGGAPAPVAAPASQFALLVMRPCGGHGEAAAEGAPSGAAVPAGHAGCPCEAPADAEEDAGEDEADLLDTSDPPGGGESTASLEDLEDEETHSGGEGGSGGCQRRGGGGAAVSKTCTYEGCSETTSQVAKQRKPWMCKKHRNKMYKDKYKKKKSDQALNCGGAASAGSAGSVKLEESTDNILSIVKQRTGSFGDRPARPSLLEQVLNQKRLSLLRSPEVVQFLQKQQQLLNQQVLEQRQQQFPGASV
ncbi:regulatory factor X-associated protein [Ctenodactylus gundi]